MKTTNLKLNLFTSNLGNQEYGDLSNENLGIIDRAVTNVLERILVIEDYLESTKKNKRKDR